MPEAKRTLVKSTPELWAELADPTALARHLGPFGSVRITRTEPESLVQWEGDRAVGAVRLETSGFGTRVTLAADAVPATAAAEAVGAPATSEPATGVEDPPSPPQPSPHQPGRPSWFARLFRRGRAAASEPAAAAGPPPAAPPASAPPADAPPPAHPAMDDAAILRVLTDCLDSLGAAHHRPFSRV